MTISRRLLPHRVTISGDVSYAVPVGRTESVPFFPAKETDQLAHIQALSGREFFLAMGMERQTTHKLFMLPGVNLAVGHLVKAETGPYAGEYYRVELVNRFDNHTEGLMLYSATDTAADTFGVTFELPSAVATAASVLLAPPGD